MFSDGILTGKELARSWEPNKEEESCNETYQRCDRTHFFEPLVYSMRLIEEQWSLSNRPWGRKRTAKAEGEMQSTAPSTALRLIGAAYASKSLCPDLKSTVERDKAYLSLGEALTLRVRTFTKTALKICISADIVVFPFQFGLVSKGSLLCDLE